MAQRGPQVSPKHQHDITPRLRGKSVSHVSLTAHVRRPDISFFRAVQACVGCSALDFREARLAFKLHRKLITQKVVVAVPYFNCMRELYNFRSSLRNR